MPRHNRPLKIGVVGANVAGLACAIAFARDGHRVDVFEKNKSLEPIESGLLVQPQGIAAIELLGLLDEFCEQSLPINQLLGKNGRGWRLFDLHYPGARARSISSLALLSMLQEKAKELGVSLRFNATVSDAEVTENRAMAMVNSGQMDLDLLIIADQNSSSLISNLGFGKVLPRQDWGGLSAIFAVANWANEFSLEQRFQGLDKMMSLLPMAKSAENIRLFLSWSLLRTEYAHWRLQPISVWRRELRQLWPEAEPVIAQIVEHDQFSFQPEHNSLATSLARPPFCLVGNPAHTLSPHLGLGPTLDIQDAVFLSREIRKAGISAGLQSYSSILLGHLEKYRTLSRRVRPYIQGEGRGNFRDVVGISTRAIPGISRYVLGVLAK